MHSYFFCNPRSSHQENVLFKFKQQSKGPCINRRQRYYFNKRAGKCQQFSYGGCKGNANNFLTYDSCYAKCVKRMYGGLRDDHNMDSNHAPNQNKTKTNSQDSDDNTNVCKKPMEKGNQYKNNLHVRTFIYLIDNFYNDL